MESDDALAGTIEAIHRELAVTMFLTRLQNGCTTCGKHRSTITGRTRQMIDKDNPARCSES